MVDKVENDALFIEMFTKGKYVICPDTAEITNRYTGAVISKVKTTFNTSYKGKPVNIGICRLMWLLFKGPVPEGSLVYRKCVEEQPYLDNLELRSISDQNRVIAKSRNYNGTNNNKASSFTDEQVVELRNQYRKEPFSLRARAKDFNVGHATLSSALSGKTYSHIPDPVTIINTIRPKKGSPRKGISMANRAPRKPSNTPRVVRPKQKEKPVIPVAVPRPVPNAVKPVFTEEDKKRRLELIREKSAKMKRY